MQPESFTLTSRERLRRLLLPATVPRLPLDRLPVLEWATWWDQTIHDWEAAGLPLGMDSLELMAHFGLDPLQQFWLAHRHPDCPRPRRHGAGIMKTRADYEHLRPLLLPDDAVERIGDSLAAVRPAWEAGDTIVWYTLEGFFWWPRELFGIEDHFFAFYDEPDLYHRICEDLLDWQLRMVRELGRYLRADFMTIAEDLSYNHGPMLSEALYMEFLHPYYRRLIPEIKRLGTRVFIDSDGDITRAVPWFLASGIEGILPLERQAGVDVAELRRRWPELLLLGAFDKMALLRGPDAVDREFARLAPVVRQGRFLPGVDHQTPPGVSMATYRHYVAGLRALDPNP